MLSKRLASLRKEKKRTQQDMADFLGITRPAYTAYELGNRQPDYETLQKLADFFEVTTDYLLGRSNERNVSPSKSKVDVEHFDSLAEINKLIKEYGIEQFGFFDIEKWKNLTEEDIDEIRRHFEWVAQKAKERSEKK